MAAGCGGQDIKDPYGINLRSDPSPWCGARAAGPQWWSRRLPPAGSLKRSMALTTGVCLALSGGPQQLGHSTDHSDARLPDTIGNHSNPLPPPPNPSRPPHSPPTNDLNVPKQATDNRCERHTLAVTRQIPRPRWSWTMLDSDATSGRTHHPLGVRPCKTPVTQSPNLPLCCRRGGGGLHNTSRGQRRSDAIVATATRATPKSGP